jgi:hypothetical protein
VTVAFSPAGRVQGDLLLELVDPLDARIPAWTIW